MVKKKSSLLIVLPNRRTKLSVINRMFRENDRFKTFHLQPNKSDVWTKDFLCLVLCVLGTQRPRTGPPPWSAYKSSRSDHVFCLSMNHFIPYTKGPSLSMQQLQRWMNYHFRAAMQGSWRSWLRPRCRWLCNNYNSSIVVRVTSSRTTGLER